MTRSEQERNRSEQDDSNRVGETFADVFDVQETENVVGHSCFHQRFLEDVVVVVDDECDDRKQVVVGGSEDRSERVSQLPTLGTMSSSLSRPPSNSSHSSSSSSSLPTISLFVNEFKPPSTHVSFGEDEKVRCRRTTDEGLLLSLITLVAFFLLQFETSMW